MAASSGFSNDATGSSGRSWGLLPEYDEVLRGCDVYLFTTTIPIASIFGEEHKELRHWALIFMFEDGSLRMVEATNLEEKLHPVLYKSFPYPEGEGKETLLGSVRTSPSKVREAAVKNKFNGSEYDLVINNCQDWIIVFLKELGCSEILKELRRKCSTFLESIPVPGLLLYFSTKLLSSLFSKIL